MSRRGCRAIFISRNLPVWHPVINISSYWRWSSKVHQSTPTFASLLDITATSMLDVQPCIGPFSTSFLFPYNQAIICEFGDQFIGWLEVASGQTCTRRRNRPDVSDQHNSDDYDTWIGAYLAPYKDGSGYIIYDVVRIWPLYAVSLPPPRYLHLCIVDSDPMPMRAAWPLIPCTRSNKFFVQCLTWTPWRIRWSLGWFEEWNKAPSHLSMA